MHKQISLRTFIAGLITTAFLAGCSQTYPRWYYQAQLDGLQTEDCRMALREEGGKGAKFPEICSRS